MKVREVEDKVDRPMDANRCCKELYDLVERFEPDVAIYSLTMKLGELLAAQAKDPQHADELLEDTTSLLAERVGVNMAVSELAQHIRKNAN